MGFQDKGKGVSHMRFKGISQSFTISGVKHDANV